MMIEILTSMEKVDASAVASDVKIVLHVSRALHPELSEVVTRIISEQDFSTRF